MDDEGPKVSPGWLWPLVFGVFLIVYIFFGGAADYAERKNLPKPEPKQSTISSVGTHTSSAADKIFIHNVFNAISSSTQTEYVILRASAQNKSAFSLAGFRLKTTDTRAYSIPNGITIYEPGTTERAKPIEVLPGEFVMVHSGRSPLGVSFKDNICLFLLKPQLIYPTPDVPSYLRYRGTDYTECVQHMKGSPEFLRPLWHVYLGSSRELWKNDSDIIRLIDRAGTSVDAAKY